VIRTELAAHAGTTAAAVDELLITVGKPTESRTNTVTTTEARRMVSV
jgi:hypothetical protein